MIPDISIILPTYNEKDNIINLIREIKVIMKGKKYEILVCDDNSPDGTGDVVSEKFQNDSNVRLFIRKNDKGLARAIKSGIVKSRGTIILVMDTDFNHDPKIIPHLIDKLSVFDMSIGSRYVKGGGMENRVRYYLSFVYNKIINSYLQLPVHDSLSGFFAINKKIIKNLPLDEIFNGYGDYFIRLLYYINKGTYKICEIPVYYKNRLYGQSKSRFFSMLVSYTKTVISLKKI